LGRRRQLGAKVIVRRREHESAIDFKQRLTVLIILFDVAILHCPDPRLCFLKGGSELRLLNEPISAALDAIGRLPPSSLLTGELKGKGRLPMRGTGPAVATITISGWTLLSATGVSADGTVIVGSGIDPSGRSEAWIAKLSPVATPLPASLPLFATGLSLMGWLGRRKKRKAVAEAAA
jgi:hypothetical protein